MGELGHRRPFEFHLRAGLTIAVKDIAGKCLEAAAATLADSVLPELAEELRQVAVLGTPMSVRSLAGRLSHWIVPVEAAGRHVALIEVSRTCQVLRYEIRARSRAEASTAGQALTEMTPADIGRSTKTLPVDAISGSEPARLVAVGSQTRTAWATKVQAANGRTSTAFVTPEYSWLEGAEGGEDG